MGGKQVESYFLSRGPKYAAIEFNSSSEVDIRHKAWVV